MLLEPLFNVKALLSHGRAKMHQVIKEAIARLPKESTPESPSPILVISAQQTSTRNALLGFSDKLCGHGFAKSVQSFLRANEVLNIPVYPWST